MKKIISLALVAVMTAGMAITSFAKTSDLSKEPYVDSTSPMYVKDADTGLFVEEKNFSHKYGSEFAVKINHENADEEEIGKLMSKYKATFNVKVGAENVKNVKLAKLKVDNGVRKVAKRTPIETNVYNLGKIEHNKLPGALRRYLVTNNYKNATAYVFYNDGGNFGKAGDDWTATLESTYNTYLNNFKSGATYKDDYEAMNPGDFSIALNLWGSKEFIPFPVFDATLVIPDDPAVTPAQLTAKRTAYKNELKKLACEVAEKNFKSNTLKEITKDSYDYEYCVVVETKPEMLGKQNSDIMGQITIAKTNSTANSNLDSNEHFKEVNFCELINENLVETEETVEEFDFSIDDKDGVPQLKATFEVDTTGVPNFDATFTMKTDLKIVDKYPEGWFQFYQWPANPDFKEKGKLYFYTEDENAKVYAVDKNGKLRSIQTKYDYDKEAAYIYTRGLRSYVVTNQIIKGTNK